MSQPEAMTCAEAEPLLPLVADGALDPDSDPGLFAHLATCAACQRAVAQHDIIDLVLRQAAPVEAPRRASIIRFWPYAAAASLVIAVGLYAFADRGTGRPAASPVATHAAPAAQTPMPASLQPAPSPLPATAAATDQAAPQPEVIAVRRSDGSAVYLVHQGDAWIAVDPAGMDGPTQPTHGGGSAVQVRY